MKKIFFLLLSIISGYIGLVGIAFSINSSRQDTPSGLLFVMGIIGVIGLYTMRFFWKKFRLPKK